MSGVDTPPLQPTTVGETWMRFWFSPAPLRPLALVRILTGILGLLLAWSYADDLHAWFGPAGMIPSDVVADWRSRWGVSLYDAATTSASVTALFVAMMLAFACLVAGCGSRLAALASAVLWASLLNRGPMLAGPADDCLSVLLWCLAAGPCGGDLSLDRALATRGGRRPPATSPWARLSLGLLQVHASAITLAAVLAQLKGDAWWNGTAAWWLASGAGAIDLRNSYLGSEYLMNLVTHAVVAFEVLFAIGVWSTATRRTVARIALVAWPVIGLLAGEPLWGCAMAIFAVPLADLS